MSTTAVPTLAAEVDQRLSRFDQAQTQGDSPAAAALFVKDCFWRAVAALTWNIKIMKGREGAKHMLDHTLAYCRPRDWHATEPAERSDEQQHRYHEQAYGRGNPEPRRRESSHCHAMIGCASVARESRVLLGFSPALKAGGHSEGSWHNTPLALQAGRAVGGALCRIRAFLQTRVMRATPKPQAPGCG